MNLRQLSMTQLEDLTGIDRRTVKKRLVKIEPIKGPRGALMYDTHVVLPILMSRSEDDPDEANRALAEATLKYEEARADKMRMEADRMAGTLVAVEDVGREVAKEYTYLRATLYGIPNKIDRALALEDDAAKCNHILRTQIDEALAHLQADTDLHIDLPETGNEEEAETT